MTDECVTPSIKVDANNPPPTHTHTQNSTGQQNSSNLVYSRCFNGEYLGNVGLRGQADHDVQFLQFHINWVVVFNKEHFDLLLEDLRPEHKRHNKTMNGGQTQSVNLKLK